MKDRISFIVSAYNRPYHLRCCVSSLYLQGNHEIIICDAGLIHQMQNRAIAQMVNARYNNTALYKDTLTGYHGLEALPKHQWLCFPTEDSYYVPGFAEIMLRTATEREADFVYCDALYDPRLSEAITGVKGTYSVLNTRPALGGIDKTCFIVKAKAFEAVGGWPKHVQDWRDGALAEALVNFGVPHAKSPGILVVKN